MPRLTKIYTRKGDEGYTQLGDHRISKDDLLVEAAGAIDELNSFIGLVLTDCDDTDIKNCLTQIQHELFDLGGELHFPQKVTISADKVTTLEKQLDAWNENLPTLEEFVLPRGTIHVARAVCRRAERSVVRLHRQVSLHNLEIIRYLNRLSDLLFVIARVLNRKYSKEELWNHKKQ